MVKDFMKVILGKVMTAVLVAVVLAIGSALVIAAQGWWGGITLPWTTARTIQHDFNSLEGKVEVTINEAIAPLRIEVAQLRADLMFIVDNSEPLKVVDWDRAAYQQIGPCGRSACLVSVSGARTEYGDTCGRVTDAGAQIRIDREPAIQMAYGPDFGPVRFTRAPRTLRIPLVLPTVTTSGPQEFRTWAKYERCRGPGEPKVRYSPWYELIVE